MSKYNAKENETELARGYGGTVLQVASYDTEESVNIASGSNVVMVYDTIVRLVTIDGTAWVSRNVDAGSGNGLMIGEGAEISMLLYANDTLFINDATVNYTPIVK